MLLYAALVKEKSYAEALELCGHAVLIDVSWKLYASLQHEAFEGSEFSTAAEAGSMAFERQPDPNIAYNVACALARDSQIAEACQWLERSVRLR